MALIKNACKKCGSDVVTTGHTNPTWVCTKGHNNDYKGEVDELKDRNNKR